ncbi:hypothetical protein B0T09DRAFT_259502, partial [Sordaria sp. MPI-SDFR-AT-0083]
TKISIYGDPSLSVTRRGHATPSMAISTFGTGTFALDYPALVTVTAADSEKGCTVHVKSEGKVTIWSGEDKDEGPGHTEEEEEDEEGGSDIKLPGLKRKQDEDDPRKLIESNLLGMLCGIPLRHPCVEGCTCVCIW